MSLLKGLSSISGCVALALVVTGCDSGSGGKTTTCTGQQCASKDVNDVAPAEDTNVVPAEDANVVPEVADDTVVTDTSGPNVEDVPDTAQTEDASTAIILPLSELSTTAKWFTYEADKATVKYFAVMDGGGAPHIAFDACDVCYASKKGYSQQGTKMICNSCGNSFDITGIGTENKGGGCWPGYLQVSVDDTAIQIEPEILEAGSWYFE